MEKLFESSTHRNDRYRIAQEQATVYLYQLDEAEKAIEILQSRCQDSPLETSTVWFEACYQIRDWKGCLDVLKNHQDVVRNSEHKAVLYFKMAQLELKLDNVSEAEKFFEKSHQTLPRFLEPLEMLIELSLSNKEWYKAMDYLESLKKILTDRELTERISEAISRLANGLQSG